MYHNPPQNHYSQQPSQHYPHHSQPWSTRPPPPPRPVQKQTSTGSSAPPLPPKPELRSIATGQNMWGGTGIINSPIHTSSTPSHYWPLQSAIGDGNSRTHLDIGMGNRTHSTPVISTAPRIINAIPPEHVRLLDSGRFPSSESSQQAPDPPQLSRSTTIKPNTAVHSPEIGPYALVPPTPQMRGEIPITQTPDLSPIPQSTNGLFSSPAPPPRPSSRAQFNPPPPPPRVPNRPYASTPAPSIHTQSPAPYLPHPPPMPAHHSEPYIPKTQPHTLNSHVRQISLPPFPPAPTPAPTHIPSPPTHTSVVPPPPTPAPLFPLPFAASPGPVHTGGQSWVGGLAPRASMHFRPAFQPDWNNLPPIPQSTPAPPMLHATPHMSHMIPRPPPTPAPLPISPIPAPAPPTLHIPTPVSGISGTPPRLPPPPPHTVTSPTIMTRTEWQSGLQRSGTVTTNGNVLPLPPKEPVLPPKEPILPTQDPHRSFQQEPLLPPKEPLSVQEPLQLAIPITPEASSSSSQLSAPSSAVLEERQEAELREALRMSLAVSSPAEEHDLEFQWALRESMCDAETRAAANSNSRSDIETNDELNAGSGAWTPILPREGSTEPDSVYQSRPPPPLPGQTGTSGGTPVHVQTPPVMQSASPVGLSRSGSPVVNELQFENGPPPPTYEEVAGSRNTTPAPISQLTVQPVSSAQPVPAEPMFGSVSPRQRETRNNLYQEMPSSPNLASPGPDTPPAIEVIPPSAHNSIVRRQPQNVASRHAERSSSEGSLLPQAPNESSANQTSRRSTQSPSRAAPRPRASSQARALPTTDSPPQPESSLLGFSRPRVTSVSQANSTAVARKSRASMFFSGMSSSTVNLNDLPPPPQRTWAIDEEPDTGALLLQAPERPGAMSRLRSQNTSQTNLQESLADAPPVETLLDGVTYGFRDPDPPTPVPPPAAGPIPPQIAIDEKGAFHIQTLNFRHLLRLLSHYGSTTIMATPGAIAASKSGVHSLRVVLYFVRGPHEKDPWYCRLFLELYQPSPQESNIPPDTSLIGPDTKIVAPCGPRGKLYTVPGPLPELPLSFQGLSTFLIDRLNAASRAPSDSSQRRLERLLIECYGSATGATASEEIGGRQKGSGNLSFGGLFSRVKGKLSSDKSTGMNDHTYDLISPFHIDDYR